MLRVALVNMPFANPRWPNLGLGLLKASLAAEGIACDVVYLNLDFAQQIGLEDYLWLADAFGFVLGGERLFAKHFFGEGRLPDDEQYYREILLRSDPEFGPDQRREYEAIARHVPAFLDHALASRDWRQYEIVGFTSSFQQTMPSLCLAQRIKQLRPEVKIVFGGAACDSEMGIQAIERFPLVDYVFLGEADVAFPELVRQILAGGALRLPPGVAAQARTCPARLAPILLAHPQSPSSIANLFVISTICRILILTIISTASAAALCRPRSIRLSSSRRRAVAGGDKSIIARSAGSTAAA